MKENAYVVKEVDPEGNLLNDNDQEQDYLGTSVYAEALARRILSVQTPLTIGLFARWGSGKSFLLKNVQSFLTKFEQQSITGDTVVGNKPPKQKKKPKRSPLAWICPILILVVIILVTVFSFVIVMSPELLIKPTTTIAPTTTTAPVNKTEPTPDEKDAKIVEPTPDPVLAAKTRRLRILGIIIVACVLLFALMMVSYCSNVGSMFASNTHSMWDSINLLMFSFFTVLPIDDPSDGVKSHVADSDIRTSQTLKLDVNEDKVVTNSGKRRFIYVNFKAWEYVGSDTLWAGIITNLSDKIESHFGMILCRLFRTTTLATCPAPNEVKTGFWETLFLDLGERNVTTVELIECMKEFGVVHGCHKYKDWGKAANRGTKTNGWFVVEFTEANFAMSACQNLSLRGIPAYLQDPHAPPKKGKNSKDIPMQDMKGGKERLLEHQQPKKSSDKKKHNQRSFCAHHRKYAKTTCWIPVLYWWVLLAITAVLVPILTYLVAMMFDLKIFKVIKYPRSVPTGIQIFAWLPGGVSAGFVLFRFVYAMFHSQRSRIQSAMEGSRGSMKEKLGFMDKVKNEVRTITRLIRLIEYVNQREYKVVISIDDLDRVPLDKIKSILDAVSILLSDSNSPFICLVAVDSRIAVKCIEGEMGATLLKANVNGHEYMRKIINLPFCIPEIDDEHKKSFIDGLMDQSDRTTRIRMATSQTMPKIHDVSSHPPPMGEIGRSGPIDRTAPVMSTSDMASNDVTDAIVEVPNNVVSGRNYGPTANLPDKSSGAKRKRRQIQTKSYHLAVRPPNFLAKNFLYECRRFFYQSRTVHKHLHGVPRNIKRIFNILSITTLMINCYYKQRKKQDFLRLLTEQSNHRLERSISTPAAPAPRAGDVMMRDTDEEEDQEHDPSRESDVRTTFFAENLVCWIILTDQWPYRISFILQIIEDADQRYLAGKKDQAIPDDVSLLEIYQKHVIPLLHKFKAGHEEASLMSLDGDPDIFFSFLKDLQSDGNRLTKRNVKLLMKFTVNLDQSLRQNIAYLRSVSDVDSQVDLIITEAPPKTPTPPPSHPKLPHSDSADIMHTYGMYGPGFYGHFPPGMPYHTGPCSPRQNSAELSPPPTAQSAPSNGKVSAGAQPSVDRQGSTGKDVAGSVGRQASAGKDVTDGDEA